MKGVYCSQSAVCKIWCKVLEMKEGVKKGKHSGRQRKTSKHKKWSKQMPWK